MATNQVRVASRVDTAESTVAPPNGNSADRLTILELALVGFGIWTVAFWLSLIFSLGWVPAVVIFAVLCAGAWQLLDRPRPIVKRFGEISGGSNEAIIAAALFWWFVAQGDESTWVNRSLVAVGIGLIAWLGRRSNADGSTAVIAMASVAAVAMAVTYVLSWTWFVLAAIGVAVAAIALTMSGSVHGESTRTRRSIAPTTVATLATGALLAIYVAVTSDPNPDDIYYVNKAAHYAQSPWRFYFEDHLFGVEGVRHLSTSDFFSSYEALIGVGAGLTGTSASLFRAVVVAPVAAFAIPIAFGYASRALGSHRPDLVAVVATMPLLLYRVNGDSLLLIDKIAQGKGIVALISIPALIGACFRLADKVTARRILVLFATTIGVFGLTGSAAAAAIGMIGACLLAWFVVQRFALGRAGLLMGGAALVLLAFGAVGFLIEPHTDFSKAESAEFALAEDGWIRRVIAAGRDVTLSRGVLNALIPGALAAAMFLAPNRRARLFFGFLGLIVFGVVFNPVFYGAVITDLLGLNWLAWRFGWMLPTGLAIGIVADALIDRYGMAGRTLTGVGLAVLLLAATPLPIRWGRPTHDVNANWLASAEQVIALTPDGGRYLAPQPGELAVAVMSPDVHPTYGRRLYLDEVPLWDPPAEFEYEARSELRLWIGGDPRAAGDPAELLAIVEVDTVCLPASLRPTELGQAVQADYSLRFENSRCDVWTRRS